MASAPLTAPASSGALGRPGSITLARHGEPALSRRIRLSAAGYRRWWAAYEQGGILAEQTPPTDLLDVARRVEVIFASNRRRAIDTAQAVVAGRSFVTDAVFVEAPLPPPSLPEFIKLSPRLWGMIARTAWWVLGHHEGQETRGEAVARARLAAERLERAAEAQGDVLLLAHGFFNLMIGRELKLRGWRLVENGGFRYWAQRRFARELR